MIFYRPHFFNGLDINLAVVKKTTFDCQFLVLCENITGGKVQIENKKDGNCCNDDPDKDIFPDHVSFYYKKHQ